MTTPNSSPVTPVPPAGAWPGRRAGMAGDPQMLPESPANASSIWDAASGWSSRWMREHGAVSVLGTRPLRKDQLPGRSEHLRLGRRVPQSPISKRSTCPRPRSTSPTARSPSTTSRTFERLAPHGPSRARRPARISFSRSSIRSSWPRLIHVGCSDEDGPQTWPVNRYAIEGERRTNWFANDVIKYHRTLATTLNA